MIEEVRGRIILLLLDWLKSSFGDAGCLGLVHWDDPEGWYGEGGGRRVQDGEHMYNFFLIKKINK